MLKIVTLYVAAVLLKKSLFEWLPMRLTDTRDPGMHQML